MEPAKGLVLVVDDHQEIRTVLREVLSIDGWDVEEAPDGPTGLEMARARLPGVILLDLSMPGMTGLQVLKELRADPETAALRVIVLTGHGELECQEARAGGADECLQKPFETSALLELIEQLFPGARR